VLTLTPREALFKHQVEDFSEESFLSVTKSHKNYQSRILVSQNELAKAEAQIQKIQEELKNETRLLENLNYQLSAAICDKKQLLNNSKKAFDEKFRNFNIRLPRRSFTYK
jgi:tRNA/tmRNA/rRNA uracil-C5-methylase (TrmA/RlmC/RlmD family)